MIAVMTSTHCRDSLTDLMAMDFVTFFNLEMHIVHLSYREEERAYNRFKMQQKPTQ